MNFDEHLFRASQSYHLTTGTIGITNEQEKRIESFISERDNGINANGNKVKWTDNKKKELEKLIYNKENPEIPKGMKTELRKIYRAKKYNRKFLFTNKYVKKGISQEEESFSVYQRWLKEVKGINFLLRNNKERIENEFFTGETDVNKHFYEKFRWGFDIKTSWSLETFPFEEDDLDPLYEWQDLVYMDLTNVDTWKTVYVLVNSTESTLHNEKMKYFYANDMDKSDRHEKKYNEICRDLERLHIVDYDRFVYLYPGHQLEIQKKEWHDNNWDMPLEDRVLEKVVEFDNEKIDFLKTRVEIARDYLNKLNIKT